MYTTYHFDSAEDISVDIIDSIKATYKTKAINIIIEEEVKVAFELSDEQKAILDERLFEDTSNYIPSKELFKSIAEKYGI